MSVDTTIWAALADPKRRQIVNLLEEKPRTTTQLSEFFDVSRFAVMKHLKVLEQANLITVRREGRRRWNVLNDDLVRFLRTKLAENNGPDRLVDILGLFPGHKPATPMAIAPASPITINQYVLLQASPARVFEALTDGIDSWWSRRVSSDSQMHLEPTVNGRFYEAFNTAGHGVLYATVTYIKQDAELGLRGTLELTRQLANVLAMDNAVRITLEPRDSATQVSLSQHIFGVADETTRDVCERRWRTLLDQHLRLFVEKGVSYQTNPCAQT